MEHFKTVTNEFLRISLNVYIHKGDFWFRAYEVAVALKYENRSPTIKYNIPDDEKMRVGKNIEFSNGKQIKTIVRMVNKPGLYRLLFLSDYEHRKQIKKWLYKDMLPSLRI